LVFVHFGAIGVDIYDSKLSTSAEQNIKFSLNDIKLGKVVELQF
jgi:hypothetical protein